MKKQLTKFAFTASCAVVLATGARAQTGNVGVGTTAPDASAQLDVSSTTKGFLMPRVTSGSSITSPAKGLMIFNTTTNRVEVNTGTPAAPVWTAVGSGAGGGIDSTTAGNGLSMGTGANAKQVRLGGTLDAATTITQGANVLSFTGNATAPSVFTNTASWIGSSFTSTSASTTPDKVVIGTLNGVATIGAHNNALTAWDTLAINPAGGFVAIGAYDANAKLDVNGGIATAATPTALTGAATLTADNSTVLCNTTAGGFTLTLPAATSCTGRIYTIKKIDQSKNALAFSQAIVIDDATVTTSNLPGTMTIQSNGTSWVKIN